MERGRQTHDVSGTLRTLERPLLRRERRPLGVRGRAERDVGYQAGQTHTVVIKDYEGKLLNGPNDVWLRKNGGAYFTDPYYKRPYWKRGEKEQEEHVYYLTPDHKTLRRVAEDLKQPNGIIGTPDGKTLYVADIGAGKTYCLQYFRRRLPDREASVLRIRLRRHDH